jgi:tRNA 2-selenouridine synthase
MRSAGVAWLLDLYGFKVYSLVGGYKVYRKWVLEQFEKDYPIKLIGGYTGSGKTEVLHALQRRKECIIDLEAIACHKGSAFGSLGQPPQPSQEMFENIVANQLKMLDDRCQMTENPTSNNSHLSSNICSAIWVEDESQRIGAVNIPLTFFKQMRNKKVFFLDIPFEERLNFIVKGYGHFEKEHLVNAIIRIKKKLGGLETKNAINAILENNIKECFHILLNYYDKLYLKSLQNRENFNELFNKIELSAVADIENAETIYKRAQEIKVI